MGICALVGWGQAVPAAVCLVVGTHFVPLARTFDQPQYRVTGYLLLLVSVVGLLATVWGASRRAITTGAAIALLATALHVLVRG